MNRRHFLKSLGAVFAAAAVARVVASDDVIRWNEWNRVVMRSGPDAVFVSVNGIDVTKRPDVLARIGQAIRVDHRRGVISLGPAHNPARFDVHSGYMPSITLDTAMKLEPDFCFDDLAISA